MTTATQTQIRRDTATNLQAATPAQGELGYDTTNKRLVIGDGATAGGILQTSAKDYQNQTFINWTVAGSANAITLTVPSGLAAVLAYADGLKFNFKAGSTNTGGVTINIDGLGAKNVYKMRNGALAALVANDIISGGKYDIIYDGTQFQIKGLSEGPYTSGALVLLGTATASSSASVNLTSLLSSTYDDYLIVLDAVIPASLGSDLWLRVSTNNGSTYDSSTDYSFQNLLVTNTTSVVHATGNQNFIIGSVISSGSYSATIYLHAANSASGDQKITGQASYIAAAATTSAIGGAWSGTGPVNALQFLMSSGNIASGTFKVYGIAKS